MPLRTSVLVGLILACAICGCRKEPDRWAAARTPPSNSASCKGMSSIKDWSKSFVASHSLSADKVIGSLRGTLQGVEGHLDYLGAFLDMSVNYYEHTGTQSIARSLISRAAAEV
jgi:hypothetical protein